MFAVTDKTYRADLRETVHKIWFRHVLGDLELKILFVDQQCWLICFMLQLPRNLGPHLRLVMVQIQLSFIKEMMIGHPEHLLTPHPLHPITSHFSLTSLLPLTSKVDVICVLLPVSVNTIKLIIISKSRTLKFGINNRLIFLFLTFIQCGNVVIPLDNGS